MAIKTVTSDSLSYRILISGICEKIQVGNSRCHAGFNANGCEDRRTRQEERPTQHTEQYHGQNGCNDSRKKEIIIQ